MASFVRRMIHWGEVEADLDAEITAHFELLVDRYVEQGMTPEAARRKARLQFGTPDQAK